jgi:hypothetical protein
LADTTPGSVRMSSSARLMGSTLPAMLFKFNWVRDLTDGKRTANIADDWPLIKQKIPACLLSNDSPLTSTLQASDGSAMPLSYHRKAISYQRTIAPCQGWMS